MAPVAALALGTALGGCTADVEIDGTDGVPLSDLDMDGAAPTEVVLASGDRVILREGSALSITVDGDPDETDKLRFALDDETLGIMRENDSWGSGSSVTVNVTMPPPEEIVVAGSGSILAQSLAKDAELTIGGSGDMAVETIAADSLEINIGGSGSIKGSGQASKLEINIGGSGDVDLAGLKVDDAEITIGGSGDVAFASDGTVEADIAGSGDVRVTGSAECEVNAIGSGKLTCSPAPSGDGEPGPAGATAALESPTEGETGEG
jgi:carbon monoxide dehydrogenase subunit G